MHQYDCIVIGSGQGGIPFNNHMARSGRRVVTFERAHLGGSCVNYGCTPSKTLIGCARAAALVSRAERFGVETGEVSVSFTNVMRRVRDVREQWRQGVAKTRDVEGHDVVMAEARFVKPGVVEADGQQYTAPLIVIDTGSSPAVPPIEGLDEVDYLTSLNIFDLVDRPDRLLVIGGGYIGCELGQALAQLGLAVTLVEQEDYLLAREEPWVSEFLQKQLSDEGLDIVTGRRVERVARRGRVCDVTLDNGRTIEVDQIFVAVGQKPNTEALNCSAGGIELDDKRLIRIDDQFRTTAEGVFAIGEVAGQPAFTPVAYEDHRRLLGILAGQNRRRDDRLIPHAIFTQPQIARCGMNETQARQAGHDVRCEEKDLGSVARAVEWDLPGGNARLVVDRSDNRLLGATLIGHEAAELIHMFIAPIQHGMSIEQLSETVPVHPTFGEAMHSLVRDLA